MYKPSGYAKRPNKVQQEVGMNKPQLAINIIIEERPAKMVTVVLWLRGPFLIWVKIT